MGDQQAPAEEPEPQVYGGGGAVADLMTLHTCEDAPPGGFGSGHLRHPFGPRPVAVRGGAPHARMTPSIRERTEVAR